MMMDASKSGIRQQAPIFALALLVAGLVACTSATPPVALQGTTIATPTLALPSRATAMLPTATLRPTATPPPPDSGWLSIREGLERRVFNLIDAEGVWRENVTVLRLRPDLFRFDIAYHPGNPQGLIAWQVETGALLIVNGGFFTPEFEATGLTVVGGQPFGTSFVDFGGMFGITPDGPFLRWLRGDPYVPGEPLLAALQSFPMLLTPGGIPAIAADDGERARRTVVAQDREGRLLFLVASFGHFSLFDLASFLASSDLDLDVALNLDGGASSGLLLDNPRLHLPSLVMLPTVITVYPRQ